MLLGSFTLTAQPIMSGLHRLAAGTTAPEPPHANAPSRLGDAPPPHQTAIQGEQPLPDMLLAPPAQTIQARPGDTPLKLLTRMGVAPEDAQAAVRTLSTVWNPGDLRAGQKAAILIQSDRLLSVRLALAPGRDIVVARDDTGSFVTEDQDRPTRPVPTLGTGMIRTSLSEAASRRACRWVCSAR